MEIAEITTIELCCCLQFTTQLSNSIASLTGSPVQVTIDSISAGSVKVASTVAFLSGDRSSASTYSAALISSNTSSLFGSSFGDVVVDTQSVSTTTVNNPSKLSNNVLLHVSLTMIMSLVYQGVLHA